MSGATPARTPRGAHTAADAHAPQPDQRPQPDQDPDGPGNPGGSGGSGNPDGEGRSRGRRFPLTGSTARPEGGGRVAGGGYSAPARQWPILAVTGLSVLGLVLVAADAFRVGTVLVGAALMAGGCLRWLMPSVGMLAVRSRFTDVITNGVLGITIVLLALMAQPNPILEIPILEDLMRFTVR